MRLTRSSIAIALLLVVGKTFSGNLSEWQSTQKECKLITEDFAKYAEIFGSLRQKSLSEKLTKQEKSEMLKLYLREQEKFINNWDNATKEWYQGTDLDKANFATTMRIVAADSTLIPFKFPGRSANWYQEKLFESCTSPK